MSLPTVASKIQGYSAERLDRLNEDLESLQPKQVLRWARDVFGPSLAVSSSFQTQSLPLLHMVSRTIPEAPVLLIDTGFLFPETRAFVESVRDRFGLNVRVLEPQMRKEELRRHLGEKPWRRDPDRCCYVNKVLPMRRVAREYPAIIAGVRRDQTHIRARFKVLHREMDEQFRIHPMLNMTEDDIASYINVHDLPQHPLSAQGYTSIGCVPCTQPPIDGKERSGRWAGTSKSECGLHILPTEPIQRKENTD